MRSASTSRPVERLAQRRGRAAGAARARRDSALPLGVPGAGGALVLLRHRRRAGRDAAPRTPCAHATARAPTPTGLRLCGIVDEPPRPAAARRTSPTSVCASSDDVERRSSRAAPAATPSARAELGRPAARSCATAATGSARPSSLGEHATAPRGPRSPSAASVPAAPPSCDRRARTRDAAAPRASTTPTSQPAALSPNVVGSACCSSVRAGHQRVAVLVARAARTRRRRRRAPSTISAERARARRASPRVSSDVLARRAAVDARVAGRLAQRRDERRRPGCRRARPPRAERRRGRSAASHAAAIAAAASAGITPGRAPRAARERAPRRRASPAARPRRTTASRSGVGHEERRRRVAQTSKKTVSPLALQVDVEAVAAVLLARRPASRALGPRSSAQHRVGRVGLRLVGEVDPRDEPAAAARARRRRRRCAAPASAVGPGTGPA